MQYQPSPSRTDGLCLQSARRAFTLVEMLVSVTLVLLMMTMFTSVFQMATDSLSKQRSIAASDQKVRSMTTILRSDFSKRSTRINFPFLPGERASDSKLSFAGRTGYTYISCNDPSSGMDDMIQFTVDARQLQSNPDATRFFGKGGLLFDQAAFANGDPTNTSLLANPNQPDADDGNLVADGTSSSNAAEVSYFVRGGNLIRRVMLLREPLPVAGSDLEIQPKSTSPGNQYFVPETVAGAGGTFTIVRNPSGIANPTVTPLPAAASALTTNDFWRFFDFSAAPANLVALPANVQLNGINHLSNDVTDPNFRSLGIPNFRFGFNHVTGLSREHESTSGTASFIGRFLHAETSHENFNWPIAVSSIGNPMDVQNAVALNPVTNVVTAFQGTTGRGGERRIEDIVQTGVQEFRIEIWDDRIERYVVPGHNMTRTVISGGAPVVIAGNYHLSRNAQFDSGSGRIAYGPLQINSGLAGIPHVFDSWHPLAAEFPSINRDFDGDGPTEIADQHAPYYPLKYYPPRQTGSTIVTPSGTVTQFGPSSPSPAMPNPESEYDVVTGLLDKNKGIWQPGTEYSVGDVVFALRQVPFTTVGGWDTDNDGVFEWGDDVNSSSIPQNQRTFPDQSVHIAYRCMALVGGGTPPNSGPGVPGWQSPGLRFVDNGVIWEGFVNYQPLKSVRLTIRFLDESSQQPKQLTLIMPMSDPQ